MNVTDNIFVLQSDEIMNIQAAKLKASHRISIADAFIAALCQQQKGILIHKDPEYEQLSSLIKEKRLPYKT